MTPAAYAHAACSAVGTLAKDVQSETAKFQTQLSLTKGKNPSGVKPTLEKFLATISSRTDQAVAQLKAAGTPNVANGKHASSALLNGMSGFSATLRSVSAQARALPTNSAVAFQTGVRRLYSSIQSSANGIGSAVNGIKSPGLVKAEKHDKTCKALGV